MNLLNQDEVPISESDYLYTNVSQIPNAGMGLYSALKLFKDEQIAVFEGEILSQKEANKRAKNKEDQYFINLLNGKILDSKHKDCFAKYANDATGFIINFKNNAKIAIIEVGKVCLIATKTIQVNEEIFCSYGKAYWKNHGNH
jgi:uncharacterized protein